MTVETEVATLTTAVDNLTSAVNVSKATLDAKVVNAQSAETGAIAASGTASGFSTAAAAHKDQAYTYSQSAASAVAYQDLTAIAATKSVTAVDVFVYDTSKDSDGGAWRKRTQGTSWYNETLNTATRGSRKEFPAVAVIVAEAATVTIYDGDDPTMPMWMQMTSAGGTLGWPMGASSSPNSSVFMLNGILIIGATGGYKGIRIISLLHDEAMWSWNQTGASGIISYGWDTIRSLSTASSAKNNTAFHWITGGSIVDGSVNDIAMTVLPNAPIDSATGLPIPTIAVATDGGVSVIKDDGSVVDITNSTAGWLTAYSVRFDGLKITVAFGHTDSTNSVYVHVVAIPSADISVGGVNSPNGISTYYSINPAASGSLDLSPSYSSINDISKGSFGRSAGLTLLKENTTTPSKGSVAYITSDYNTGYMVGDIKLAALSDTDDTDVVGSELVTNGTFDTATTGWTAVRDATLSVSSGRLQSSTGGSTFFGHASQGLSTVIGSTYVVTYEFVSGSSGRVKISNSVDTSTSPLAGVTATVGFGSITFKATATTTYIGIGEQNLNTTSVFDNISVRLADTDRSVNANGLAVHGTITKNPVATGADLVGYSGFSTSNYLEQPYNSDLDFGTGDFSVSCWMKSNTDNQVLMSKTTASGSGWGIGAKIALKHGIGGKVELLTANAAATSTNYLTTATPLTTGSWHFITACRKSTGVGEIYVDGKLIESIAGTVRDVSDSSNKLLVGAYWYNVRAGYNGSVALVRISATAPSAQQIKDIYEAEKPLFQAGAQATLYGTSDAVTALAHDSDTNLLHVGTGSGRSVFQGLQRVSNTTTAVGSAISASNGLVVED